MYVIEQFKYIIPHISSSEKKAIGVIYEEEGIAMYSLNNERIIATMF